MTRKTKAPASSLVKETNPKDSQATNRLPLYVVPQSFIAHVAHAFAEGDAKYGAYNWREAGVLTTVYMSAAMRHMFSYFNGEDCDPLTGVNHLASAAACLAVMIDAKECGKLNDDRPPRAPVADLIRSMEAKVAHVREMHNDRKPPKYTINGIIPRK